MTDLYILILMITCLAAGIAYWLCDLALYALRRWHEREHDRWRQAARPRPDLERAAWRETPDMGSGPHRRINTED